MTDIYLECAHYGLYPNVPVYLRAEYIALRLGQEAMQPARLPVARVRLLFIALSSSLLVSYEEPEASGTDER